jgi:hypothetical protein
MWAWERICRIAEEAAVEAASSLGYIGVVVAGQIGLVDRTGVEAVGIGLAGHIVAVGIVVGHTQA